MKQQLSFFETNRNLIKYITLIFLAFQIVSNYIYRQPLYELGVNIIASMQKDNTVMGVYFFTSISFISESVIVFVLIVLILLMEAKKKHAYNVVMFLLLNVFLITLLKSFYSDPRPFWTDKSIQSLGPYCPSEYGNPSGHSWFSTVVSFVILFEYFPKFQKLFGITLLFLTIVLVPSSRMYLGVHSLNQVIFGVSMGLAMNCLYFICGLKELIGRFLQNFNRQPLLGWKKYMILFHALYFVTYYMTQDKINRSTKIYEVYNKNMEAECSRTMEGHHLNFGMLLAGSLIVNFSTGIALGYDSMSLSQKGRKYLDGKWEINEQRFSITVGTIILYWIQIICLTLGMVCAGLLFFFFKDFGKIYIYIVLSLGAGASGYAFSGKSCKYLYQYSVINETL